MSTPSAIVVPITGTESVLPSTQFAPRISSVQPITPPPLPPPVPAELVNEIINGSQLPADQLQLLSSLGGPMFTYHIINESMNKNYNNKESNHSMICDIIAMYLKGQKILYTESKSLCEHRLNYLMLPTICITAVCTVISIALKDYQYGALIVSSLNALNFFFLNLINYLKLDAKAEAHRVSAYKFDKIQSKLEFNSGKILFIYGAHNEIEKLINDTEKDVREIKETNQFILPELIRHNYPRLHNTNVFSEVKKIQSEETIIVNHLKDIMNDLIENQKILLHDSNNQIAINNIKQLESDRQYQINKYISIKDKYLEIDNVFEDEMEEQRRHMLANQYISICSFLKT